MPVVSIDLKRFSKMVGARRKLILDRLPYIGLDIESVGTSSVRVEYSPNRPDFGSDFGIARALRGIIGRETGLPTYRTTPSGIDVTVDRRLSSVRPFIACATASGLQLDDEDVRQIISLQEDLHNGLGRKRRVVAIGLHDLDRVSSPLRYSAMGPGFGFTPLDSKKSMSIKEILSETEQGRTYGRTLPSRNVFPVIMDSNGTVLSFPPIINGNATRVSTNTKSIFIDVTSTDRAAGEDVLAILATTLAEAGAKIGSVRIDYNGESLTGPDLSPRVLKLDLEVVEQALGLHLTKEQVSEALQRSRLGIKGSRVLAPRYRIDLLHPVDLAEEVALGFGIDRIPPSYPASKQPGSFNPLEVFFDKTSTIMAGQGMIELMTFELVDEKSLYSAFGRGSESKISVHDPRSLDHSLLRDSLLPSLTAALSRNIKEDYPQRIFEIGRIYTRTAKGVAESWSLGCLVAHSQSSFSEAKMYLEATFRVLSGAPVETRAASHWAFSEGRSAAVIFGGRKVGNLGEVKPEALYAFGLGVPVAGFEVSLTEAFNQLK